VGARLAELASLPAWTGGRPGLPSSEMCLVEMGASLIWRAARCRMARVGCSGQGVAGGGVRDRCSAVSQQRDYRGYELAYQEALRAITQQQAALEACEVGLGRCLRWRRS
jgi:hypothetical protein